MPPTTPMRVVLAIAGILTAVSGGEGLSIKDFEAQITAANTSASADAFTTTAVQNVVDHIFPQIPAKQYVLIFNHDLGITKGYFWNPVRPFVENAGGVYAPVDVKYHGIDYESYIFLYGIFDKCGFASGSSVWRFTYDGAAVCKNSKGNVVGCDDKNRCRVEWDCISHDCTPPSDDGPDSPGETLTRLSG